MSQCTELSEKKFFTTSSALQQERLLKARCETACERIEPSWVTGCSPALSHAPHRRTCRDQNLNCSFSSCFPPAPCSGGYARAARSSPGRLSLLPLRCLSAALSAAAAPAAAAPAAASRLCPPHCPRGSFRSHLRAATRLLPSPFSSLQF